MNTINLDEIPMEMANRVMIENLTKALEITLKELVVVYGNMFHVEFAPTGEMKKAFKLIEENKKKEIPVIKNLKEKGK